MQSPPASRGSGHMRIPLSLPGSPGMIQTFTDIRCCVFDNTIRPSMLKSKPGFKGKKNSLG